jgi:hypothetical protein
MNVRAGVAICFLSLSSVVAGCATDESERYSARPAPRRQSYYERVAPAFVPVPEGIRPESLSWVVEAALSERHWTVNRRSPGNIQASVWSQGSGENATIGIQYGPTGIQISQLAASVTAARYDRWIRLLVTNINRHIVQIGMGRPAAPWGAPPAAAPPAAAPPPSEADQPPASTSDI